MRKIVVFMLAGSLWAFAKGPQIKFLETSHDFGNIKEKSGKVHKKFRYVNTGDAPLVIFTARVSCGCTKPTFPDAPLAPGDTAVLTVTFNPEGRPGEFSKVITVKSNSEKEATSRIKIKGCVLPPNN